jgi:hypothetical protein
VSRKDRTRLKRTTKLTIETRRVLLIRRVQSSRQLSCEECGEGVRFVTAPEAATIADTSQRTIYRWAEAGRVHFIEPDDDSLLVCFDSLCDHLIHTERGVLLKWSNREEENDEYLQAATLSSETRSFLRVRLGWWESVRPRLRPALEDNPHLRTTHNPHLTTICVICG